MSLKTKLSTLEKYRDYALWKMESTKGGDYYSKAKQIFDTYTNEINKLLNKKEEKLSLF